jgi:CHAT domain-containing protein/tetratricopeptide (TPR) repeat protein
MIRVLTVAVGLWLASGVAAADEPRAATTPQWQRLLTGDDAKQAAALTEQIAALEAADKYPEAIRRAEELLALRTRVQGADHWEAVSLRHVIAGMKVVVKLPDDQRAAVRKVNHAEAQAMRLFNHQRYKDAVPLTEQALETLQLIFGDTDPLTAGRHTNMGYVLWGSGRFSEALPHFRKALEVHRATLGEFHPDTAACADGLALTLGSLGRLAESEPYSRAALTARRQALGEDNVLTALSMSNLGNCLEHQGRYTDAEALHRAALDVRRRVLGDHPDTATTCSSLAAALAGQGGHAEAGLYYQRALDLRLKTRGKNHAETARSYNNLAYNLDERGLHAEAEALFLTSVAIRQGIFGDDHPETAAGMNSLAVHYAHRERYADAEPLYRKALATRRKAFGELHPDTLQTLGNLAATLDHLGRFTEAAQLYQQVVDARRKVLGEDHPSTALAYYNLALAMDQQKRYAEAEPLYRKALAIRRKALGELHPEKGWTNYQLAKNQWARGRAGDAVETLGAAARAYESARIGIGQGLERAVFRDSRSPHLLQAAFQARLGQPLPAWVALEADLARGLLDATAGGAGTALPPDEQVVRDELAAKLTALRPRLFTLITQKQLSPAEKAESDRLQRERAALELRLGELAAAASRRLLASQDKVQEALPSDTVILTWVDYTDAHGRVAEHWACVLRPSGDPTWESLPGTGTGGAWTTEDLRLTIRFRQALAGTAPAAEVEMLARHLHAQRLAPVERHLAGITRLLVVPAGRMAGIPVEALTDRYKVSYIPSGTILARLKATPKPSGTALLAVGDPAFIRPGAPSVQPPQGLPPGGLLVTQVIPGGNAAGARIKAGDVLLEYAGSPVNDIASLQKLTAANEKSAAVEVKVWREGEKEPAVRQLKPGRLGVVLHPAPAPEAIAARRKGDQALVALARGGDWKELPGTRVELDRLARLFGDQATVLAGSDASEQRLDALRAAGELKRFRYLHLATHGEANDERAFESALILAQDKLPKDLPPAGQKFYDGRLTANEVLADWKLDAELVTLSACETALGREGGGEGFLGFAQAFLSAGSRAVCLSLWKVDDAATTLLMDRFYANLLGRRPGLDGPLGKAAALAEARRWLRGLSAEDALRISAELAGGVARGKAEKALALAPPAVPTGVKEGRPFAHPRYWAGFVLIGAPD